MNYQNIKLDKSMYKSGVPFSAQLEKLDPSANYAGTDLAGMDAFQRQLKRFDIRVSGANSDPVSKFFSTADSAALFPEYVARAVMQGADETAAMLPMRLSGSSGLICSPSPSSRSALISPRPSSRMRSMCSSTATARIMPTTIRLRW